MTNITESGRIGMLLLVPGVDETLRINGGAEISRAPDLLAQFKEKNHPPKSCIVVNIEEVFLHCAKALMRSRLWSPDAQIERQTLPTMGQMLNGQLGLATPVESQQSMVERYKKDL